MVKLFYFCLHVCVCTSEIKDICFAEITEFEKNSDEFIKILDNMATEVEKEKMKTIGARNLLRSVSKQREAQKQQMQVFK